MAEFVWAPKPMFNGDTLFDGDVRGFVWMNRLFHVTIDSENHDTLSTHLVRSLQDIGPRRTQGTLLYMPGEVIVTAACGLRIIVGGDRDRTGAHVGRLRVPSLLTQPTCSPCRRGAKGTQPVPVLRSRDVEALEHALEHPLTP